MVIIAIILLLLVVLGGFIFWLYIVKYGTLDKNGMENPDYADNNGEIHMVDGDYTYVDSGALIEKKEVLSCVFHIVRISPPKAARQ